MLVNSLATGNSDPHLQYVKIAQKCEGQLEMLLTRNLG